MKGSAFSRDGYTHDRQTRGHILGWGAPIRGMRAVIEIMDTFFSGIGPHRIE